MSIEILMTLTNELVNGLQMMRAVTCSPRGQKIMDDCIDKYLAEGKKVTNDPKIRPATREEVHKEVQLAANKIEAMGHILIRAGENPETPILLDEEKAKDEVH